MLIDRRNSEPHFGRSRRAERAPPRAGAREVTVTQQPAVPKA
jgi:hypothetical protein